MIQKVIDSLNKIDNPVAKDLLSVFNNTQPTVDEAYYTSTVFETQANYKSLEGVINGQVVAPVQKAMVETPLVFIRAKQQPVFCSGKNQGISFGFTMVDYRSSQPLVISMITKSGTKYEYKSIMFDKETNAYIDSETSSKACKTFKDLMDHVAGYVSKDVTKWTNKY